MSSYFTLTLVLCLAATTVSSFLVDRLATGQLLRDTLCAKDEQICLYYATCCKLTEQFCSNRSKNCETILRPGEELSNVCCRALHNATLLDRPGVLQACQGTYGASDFWPRGCKAESTTGASTSLSLLPTEIAPLEVVTNGSNDELKASPLDNIHGPMVPAALTAEVTTHNRIFIGVFVSIAVLAVAVITITLVCLKKNKWLCFTGPVSAVNDNNRNTAENENYDNKQIEQTEMLASIGSSASELHRRQQGSFQAAIAEQQEVPVEGLAGPGLSEPNGGVMNTSEEEDTTTETTCLTWTPGRVVLE